MLSLLHKSLSLSHSRQCNPENKVADRAVEGLSCTVTGDGNRVKFVIDGVTTYYVGHYFEWTGSTNTMVRYYYVGGQRVATQSPE